MKILNKMNLVVEFNFNECILVKLTKFGHNQLRAQHELIRTKLIPTAQDWPYNPPKEDEHGWSEHQAWSILQKLGSYLGLGLPQPFHTTIRLKGVKYHAKVS